MPVSKEVETGVTEYANGGIPVTTSIDIVKMNEE